MSEHYIEVELREIRIMKNAGEPLFPIVLVEKTASEPSKSS